MFPAPTPASRPAATCAPKAPSRSAADFRPHLFQQACRAGAADRQRQDALEQILVFEPVVQSRRGELLGAGDLGIGIGLDVIGRAVGGEPEIDARKAVELERAIDTLGVVLDAR